MGWESLIPAVVVISASGALAPGPLFFATVSYGLKGGARSGFMVALGHTAFELPLVMAVAVGLVSVANIAQGKLLMGIVGSVAIAVFGVLQLRDAIRQGSSFNNSMNPKIPANAFLVGLLFTGLNPLFIVWWLTVGMKLILDSLLLASLMGVGIMYVSHVWMDYAWLVLVSHLASRASRLIAGKWMRLLMLSLSLTLIILGVVMLINVLSG